MKNINVVFVSVWNCISMELYQYGTVSVWNCISMELYQYGTVSVWNCISMELYQYGTVSVWNLIVNLKGRTESECVGEQGCDKVLGPEREEVTGG